MPQKYGTQYEQNKRRFYPISDPCNLEQRRFENGLEPMSIYVKLLGISENTIPNCD